ncbi:hypothetical protein Tter_0926 [Thermobaculum terrenum ATCC BAA-798]|uniref:Uncharacterized protein n=1 Tax=Thermobaculum terrenum (strain ATCC BAA-798 / CCMEE 7001 / YNP1) TaxID=525904 RepID=D1CFY7_THET1|nr:hypothetical protein Tter_0926 [Thermobaculum terrenum ATCC BAA-798]
MLKTRRVRANAFLFGQHRKEVQMEQKFLTPREAGRIPAEALDPEALRASGNKKGHQSA